MSARNERYDRAVEQGNANVDNFIPETADAFSARPTTPALSAVEEQTPLWNGTLHTCTHWTPGDTHVCDCPIAADHTARDLV
jgi:hypothetical protein